MIHRRLRRTVLAAASTAAFVLAGAIPALADTLTLQVREGRTVANPADSTIFKHDGAKIDASTPYHWVIVRDTVSDPWQGFDEATGRSFLSLGGSAAQLSSYFACRPSDAPAAQQAALYQTYPVGCNWASLRAIDPGTTGNVQVPASGSLAANSAQDAGTVAVMTAGDNVATDPRTLGDQTVLAGTRTTVAGWGPSVQSPYTATPTADLPAGKYFVSVYAQGYEVAGTSFTVVCGADNLDVNGVGCSQPTTKAVDVFAQFNPQPLVTVRRDVFADVAPTNSEYDRTEEQGLNGFKAVVTDITGEAITTDAYVHQICSDYVPLFYGADQLDSTNAVPPNKMKGMPVLDGAGLSVYQLYDGNGDPVFKTAEGDYRGVHYDAVDANHPERWIDAQGNIAQPQVIPGTGGKCLSHSEWIPDPENAGSYIQEKGHVVIRNLEPNRNTTTISPPDVTGGSPATIHRPEWTQTSTLEGAHDWDIWSVAGDSGFDWELVNGGEKVAWAFSGWVHTSSYNGADGLPTPGPTTPTTAITIAGNGNVPGNLIGRTVTLVGDTSGTVHTVLSLRDRTFTVDTPFSDVPAVGASFTVNRPQGPFTRAVAATATGSIHGFVHDSLSYSPNPVNGNYIGQNEYSLQQDAGAEKRLEVALVDFQNGDRTIWSRSFFADDPAIKALYKTGEFKVEGVLPGDYGITVWDWDQNQILYSQNVTVVAGEQSEMDTLRLPRWWTHLQGSVFNDLNGNGKQDFVDTNHDGMWEKGEPGEPGLPHFFLSHRSRENTLFEQGTNSTFTDQNGNYDLPGLYPIGQWTILEAFDTAYKNTGITVQSGNDAKPTTYLGGAVDINVIPWITQAVRINWAKQPYTKTENGGIVGTVSYGTTRNETQADQAKLEDWQPGIPGIRMHLFKVAKDAAGHTLYDPKDGSVMVLDPSGVPANQNDLIVKDKTAASPDLYDAGPAYTTERWARPVDCTTFNAKGGAVAYPWQAEWGYTLGTGNALVNGNFSGVQDHFNAETAATNAVPWTTPVGLATNESATQPHECVEGIGGGSKVGLIPDGNGGKDWGAKLNGNYALTDVFTDSSHGTTVPMSPGDYVVKEEIPVDKNGNAIYNVTKEEDINVYTGDTVGQPNAPKILFQECSGISRQVDVLGAGTDGYGAVSATATGQTTDINKTALPQSFPIANDAFAGTGGSPYEGKRAALCDSKVVHVDNSESVAPSFELFTNTPLPGIHFGLLIDDLNVSIDPKESFYGDKSPAVHMPLSFYDWSGRLQAETVTDANGYYSVMLPTTNRINAPTPSGVSPQVYTLVANDPSTADPKHADYNDGGTWTADGKAVNDPLYNPRPTKPNQHYNAQYRTIAAPFQLYPGVSYITDLALTSAAAPVQGAGATSNHPADCMLQKTGANVTPQVFSIDKVATSAATGGDFVVKGIGFGTAPSVKLVNEENGVLSYAGSVTSYDTQGYQVQAYSPTTTGTGTYQQLAGGTVAPAVYTGTVTIGGGGATNTINVGAVNPFPAPWTGTISRTVGGSTTTYDVSTNASGSTLNGTFTLPAGSTWNVSLSRVKNGSGTVAAGGAAFSIPAPGYPTGWAGTLVAGGVNYPVTVVNVLGIRILGTFNLAAGTPWTVTLTQLTNGAYVSQSYTSSAVVGSIVRVGAATYTVTAYTAPSTAGAGTRAFAVPARLTLAGTTAPATGAAYTIDGAIVATPYTATGAVGATVSFTAPGAYTGTISGTVSSTGTATGKLSLTGITPAIPAPSGAATYSIAGTQSVTISPRLTVDPAGLYFKDQAFSARIDSSQGATFNPGIQATQLFLSAAQGTPPVAGDGTPASATANAVAVDHNSMVVAVDGGTALVQAMVGRQVRTASGFTATIAGVTTGTNTLALDPTTVGRQRLPLPGERWEFLPGLAGVTTTSVAASADNLITVHVPAGAAGSYQLYVDNTNNNQEAVNAVSIFLLGSGAVGTPTNPRLFEVGPNAGSAGNGYLAPLANQFKSIQAAIDASANIDANAIGGLGENTPGPGDQLDNRPSLIMVHPGSHEVSYDPTNRGRSVINPRGAYFENLIVPTRIKLQGFGAGGDYPSSYSDVNLRGTTEDGTVIDGSQFGTASLADGSGTAYAVWWYDLATWVQGMIRNTDTLQDGAVVTVLTGQRGNNSLFNSAYRAAVDGFQLTGGTSFELPGGLNTATGGGPLPARTQAVGQPASQGGGVFAASSAHYLEVKNNIINQNAGSLGGGIRIGSPYVPELLQSAKKNDHVTIANNQLDANGGFRLAGAVGLFNGSDDYTVQRNVVCGNYSAEYGGGISHYGLSPNGMITKNRVYFNQSYDEGAGVFIAGQLPNPKLFPGLPPQPGISAGSGTVTIDANVIQSNLAGDDGGGIRFLMAGNHQIKVTNNVIANNVSAHEGGGIAIDDTSKLLIANNTIMKNLTTATAMTSNGQPAPAGLSTALNSVVLMGSANVPASTPPTLLNNYFWGNLAGTYNGGIVTGIGLSGDTSNPAIWDIGSVDGVTLYPQGSTTTTSSSAGASPDSSLLAVPAPASIQDATYDTSVILAPFRGDANFIAGTILAIDFPSVRMGNYKSSSAIGGGVQCVDVADGAGPASTYLSTSQTNCLQTGVGSNPPALGRERFFAPGTDIDGEPRAATAVNDRGADQYNGGTKSAWIAPLVKGGTLKVSAAIGRFASQDPHAAPVGSIGGLRWSPVSAGSTATLQVKVGSTVRSYRMTVGTRTYNVSVNLKAGTYRVRVVIATGRSKNVSAWQTVSISNNRKGAK